MKELSAISKVRLRFFFCLLWGIFSFFSVQADGTFPEEDEPFPSIQDTPSDDTDLLEDGRDVEEGDADEEDGGSEDEESVHEEEQDPKANKDPDQRLRDELAAARASVFGESLGYDAGATEVQDSDRPEEGGSVDHDSFNQPVDEDSSGFEGGSLGPDEGQGVGDDKSEFDPLLSESLENGDDDISVDIKTGWREGKEIDIPSDKPFLGSKFASPLATPKCSSCGDRVVPDNTGDFDFGMASFGIEAGVNVPNYSYSTSLGNGSYGTHSSQQGALGFRLTWEKLINKKWTAGVTGSLRYYFGSVKGTHNSVNALSQTFEASTTQRYELAAKFGWPSGIFSPYIKVGPVASNILIKYQDTTFALAARKQFIWGSTFGGGMDTEISEGLLMGGLVEYDYYGKVKSNLYNSTGNGGGYKISPSFLNVMFTVTCKMDQYF